MDKPEMAYPEIPSISNNTTADERKDISFTDFGFRVNRLSGHQLLEER